MQSTRFWLISAIICLTIVGVTFFWNASPTDSNDPIAQLTDENTTKKLLAISKISQNKSQSAVPNLIALVKNPNEQPNVQSAAIRAIGKIGGKRSFTFLQEVLTDEIYDKTQRATAAQAFSFSSNPKTQEILISALDTEPELVVQIQILQTLTKFRGPKTEEAFTSFIEGDNDPKSEAFALLALLKVNEDDALPLMIDEFQKTDDPQIQMFYAQSFAQLKDPETIDPLLHVLKTTGNEQVKKVIIVALAQMKVDKAADEFINILNTTDDSLTALYAVGGINLLGDKQAVGPLTKYYDKLKLEFDQYQPPATTPQEAVTPDQQFYQTNIYGRAAIIQTLAKIDPRGSIDIFRDVIKTKTPEKGDPKLWIQLKRAAIGALATTKSQEASSFLVDQGLLESETLALRLGALQALSQLKSKEALPAIIKLLQDENNTVKQQAAVALGNFQDPQAVTALIGVLKDKNDGVVAAALRSLIKLDDPQAIIAVEKTATSETSSQRVKKIAEKLLAEREQNTTSS